MLKRIWYFECQQNLFQLRNKKIVVMDVTMAPAIFKPEKNLVFFQDKIAGAIDDYPGKLE